jgi:hypothetical protein
MTTPNTSQAQPPDEGWNLDEVVEYLYSEAQDSEDPEQAADTELLELLDYLSEDSEVPADCEPIE